MCILKGEVSPSLQPATLSSATLSAVFTGPAKMQTQIPTPGDIALEEYTEAHDSITEIFTH